jgi:hypothetical protein
MSTRDYVIKKTNGLCHRSYVHPTAGLVCFDDFGQQAAIISTDGSVSLTTFDLRHTYDDEPLMFFPVRPATAYRILKDW